MSDASSSSSNGINTRKKNVSHSCPNPIMVCTNLIQEIKLKVSGWEKKPDAKIAGTLIRAMPKHDLTLPPSGKPRSTVVTLDIPKERDPKLFDHTSPSHVVIPLLVEPTGEKGVQLALDHKKQIELF